MQFEDILFNALGESRTIYDDDDVKSEKSNTSDNGSEGTTMSTSGSVEDTHSTPNYVPGTFEGPEKSMEVVFRSDIGPADGLRSFSREQLDKLCTQAKCTILSKISSYYIDAYVLSESSLFVYNHRFIMKTCGTTTLLRCLSTLLQYADEIGMVFDWVGYSRKNLLFPSAQLWPHSNFGEEINYLNTHEKLQDRLRGSGHILGPITGDHWFVYAADHSLVIPFSVLSNKSSLGDLTASEHAPSNQDRTLNMMMFDMDPEVAAIFFQKSGLSGREMTEKSGITHLCPGATIDETSFTPCGYSMNAILHDSYYTIHITPEQECSYCSFETNTSLKSYAAMVRNVLNVFRPKRFVLTMFGDDEAVGSLPELPTDPRRIEIPGFGIYKRTSVSSSHLEKDLFGAMGCFILQENALPGSSRPLVRGVSIGNLRERGFSM